MVRMLTRNKIRVIDAGVVPRTEDGALIHMSYGGRATFPDELEGALRDASSRHLIDPSRYYFRTTPLFETGAMLRDLDLPPFVAELHAQIASELDFDAVVQGFNDQQMTGSSGDPMPAVQQQQQIQPKKEDE